VTDAAAGESRTASLVAPIDVLLVPPDTAHQRVERVAPPTQHVERADRRQAEERWLDLIADVIAEQLLNEDARDADPLRNIREV